LRNISANHIGNQTPFALSIASADRRVDRAMQITFPVGRASPHDGAAAAWKIANGIAFEDCLMQPRQLVDDAQSLLVFLDPGLYFADVFLAGGDGAATALLREARAGGGKPTQSRQ
jgi:hypothetical protein